MSKSLPLHIRLLLESRQSIQNPGNMRLLVDFLSQQPEGFLGVEDPSKAFIYSMHLENHLYIGRTAARRQTRTWGGAAHRFKEHIIDMAKHRLGTIRKNAIRSRYQQMGRTIKHQYPSIILNQLCPVGEAAGYEAANISMCHPSANNLEKTFGVKVHSEKPPSRGRHLHLNKKKRNRLSQRQAEQLSRS